MRRSVRGILFVVFCLFVWPLVFSVACNAEVVPQKILRIELPDQKTKIRLGQLGIGLDKIHKDYAIAYANEGELKELESRGFKYVVLYEDERVYHRERLDRVFPKEKYLSYDEMLAQLEEWAITYSDIMQLHNWGTSVDGRGIWAMKITDNPDIEENEPEVRICGCHHGDEAMSAELTRELIGYIGENYGSSYYITRLVNDRETWIMPMVNPDGLEAYTRANANGVDLNRNYGYMWEHGSSGPFSEPEGRALRAMSLENPFVFGLSLHGAAEYFNYVWNYHPMLTPDDDLLQHVGDQYATWNGYTVIEGWYWYQTNGDTNDWSYGCAGCLDTTIETPEISFENDWAENRDAMLYIIDAAGMGLHGVVTDLNSGVPLWASVEIHEVAWPMWTDPAVGDYHRPLLPGTYAVTFSANGYESLTVPNVVITDGKATDLNAELKPDYSAYAWRVEVCEYGDIRYDHDNETSGHDALNAPDEIPASIGPGGYIVLDMGPGFEIEDRSGADFTVVEAGIGDGDEGYEVFLGNNALDGPWTSVGTGTGTQEFDIEGTGVVFARYIRIADDDVGGSGGSNPGFDLDAIIGRAPITGCGIILFDKAIYNCASVVTIEVYDLDLNVDPGVAEQVNVTISGDSNPTGVVVTLTESGPDASQFVGTVVLSTSPGPGQLLVADGDTITGVYQDEDCEGSPAVVTVDAIVDCDPPQIVNIQVHSITDHSAIVSWETSEECAGEVIYGPYPPPPGSSVSSGAPGTTHQVLLDGLDDCTDYLFAVKATDAAGNVTTDDNSGAYHEFQTWREIILLSANMDTDPGWTTTENWAWGQPTGQGGEHGSPDPTSGYTGVNVYGYNLNGDYESSMSEEYLTTLPFDCSGAPAATLRFQRKLGVEQPNYDHAKIEAQAGGGPWETIWENSETIDDPDWTLVSYDISSYVAGESNVRIRWVMGPTDGSYVYCGWNIDDVEIVSVGQCGTPTPTMTPGGPTYTPTPTYTPIPPTPTPSGNDDCPGMVIYAGDCVCGTTTDMAGDHDCGSGHSGPDVVFHFVGLASGASYKFIGEADYDADWTIATVCDGDTGDVLCVDRQAPNEHPSCTNIGVVDNWGYATHEWTATQDEYWIWVDGYFSTSIGDFCIEVLQIGGPTATPTPAHPTRTPTMTPTNIPTPTPTCTPAEEHDGDVDDDGKITPLDSYIALQLYLGIPVPGANLIAADFCPRPNGDGAVDPGDAFGILREYLGFPDPCD